MVVRESGKKEGGSVEMRGGKGKTGKSFSRRRGVRGGKSSLKMGDTRKEDA